MGARPFRSRVELVEAVEAIRLVVLLLEALRQHLEAVGAGEVVRVELSEHGRGALADDWLAADGAKRAAPGVVVDLAVGQPVDVEELAVAEGTVAVGADETIWVPLDAERRDVVGCDGQIAAAALVGEQVEEVVLTIRFAVLLVKTVVHVELATAMGADKVLGVESLLQGYGDLVQNWLLTGGALGRKQLLVVSFAVGQIVALVKVPRAQLLVTVGTGEMFAMIIPAQGRDHLANDSLAAHVTVDDLAGVQHGRRLGHFRLVRGGRVDALHGARQLAARQVPRWPRLVGQRRVLLVVGRLVVVGLRVVIVRRPTLQAAEGHLALGPFALRSVRLPGDELLVRVLLLGNQNVVHENLLLDHVLDEHSARNRLVRVALELGLEPRRVQVDLVSLLLLLQLQLGAARGELLEGRRRVGAVTGARALARAAWNIQAGR